MRSGGKGMWGQGPALYKHNYLKKNKNISCLGFCKTDQSWRGLVSEDQSDLTANFNEKIWAHGRFQPMLGIRIRMFLDLLDLDPDLIFRGTDPESGSPLRLRILPFFS